MLRENVLVGLLGKAVAMMFGVPYELSSVQL